MPWPVLAWVIIGVVLLLAEVFTSGSFVLMFYGVAALVVAALRFFGFGSVTSDLLIFAGLGSAGLFFFRHRLRESLSRNSKGFEIDRQSEFRLSTGIGPHGEALVSYQGSTWTAVNDSDMALEEGTRVFVKKVEGIRIYVARASSSGL